MCNEISYRTAITRDAEEMVAVHFRSVQAIPECFYSAAIKDSWSPEPDSNRIAWLSGVIASEDTIVTVAQSNEEVVGFIIYSSLEHQINALYVDPSFAGQGIGAHLLRTIEESGEVGGITLKASLNAVDFYSRAGFTKVREAEQRLSDGSVMAAVDMVKAVGGTPDNAVNEDG